MLASAYRRVSDQALAPHARHSDSSRLRSEGARYFRRRRLRAWIQFTPTMPVQETATPMTLGST
jgi:hypothetical protein